MLFNSTQSQSKVPSNYCPFSIERQCGRTRKAMLMALVLVGLIIWMLSSCFREMAAIRDMQSAVTADQFLMKENRAQWNDLLMRKKQVEVEYLEKERWNNNLKESNKLLEKENADLTFVLGYNEFDMNGKMEKLAAEIKDCNSLITIMETINDLTGKIQATKSEIKALVSLPEKSRQLSVNSKILTSESQVKMITEWLNSSSHRPERVTFQLLYRMTLDGFNGDSFHRRCDNIPNTLTILKTTKGLIIGGYTHSVWDHLKNDYSADINAFLFNLSIGKKFPVSFSDQAIYSHHNYLAVFGVTDLLIRPQEISSFFPNTYGTHAEKHELTNGDNVVSIDEMEVFKVVYVW